MAFIFRFHTGVGAVCLDVRDARRVSKCQLKCLLCKPAAPQLHAPSLVEWCKASGRWAGAVLQV